MVSDTLTGNVDQAPPGTVEARGAGEEKIPLARRGLQDGPGLFLRIDS